MGRKVILLESAKDILIKYNVDFSSWGTGETKTLDHLEKEYEAKESVFFENSKGQLIRKIRLIFIDVWYSDDSKMRQFKLVEEKQVFIGGRTRYRNWLPGSVAEKLKPYEEPNEKAVARALQEELGIIESNRPIFLSSSIEREQSKSFPGLTTESESACFLIYLSKENFNPSGYIEKQPDKDTYFTWTEAQVPVFS